MIATEHFTYKSQRMKLLFSGLFLASICALAPARADLLTFTGNACSANADGSGALVACANYSYINQSYGDTATANITYHDLINSGNSLKWWGAGFNNLSNAVWGGNGDANGQSWDRILIAPTAGYTITLNSFLMGADPATRTTNLQILDYNSGAVLFQYGVQTIGTGGVATSFSPNVSSSDGLIIDWSNDAYNVGIDDVNFTSSITAPEPSAGILLLSAMVLAGVLVRKRGKQVYETAARRATVTRPLPACPSPHAGPSD